ncbi:hypothetical protein TWF694_007226 [Orbilia ellipsospora]|uniref:DUF7580 domain-containing protein n=1 Tax=Orbilia ellipsospora TaxID=2528407 RepID=A0AAV9XHM4_9PEZI
MSGIEIAGLLLGAIPLVISALEHYEDIIGPTKAFFKYKGELDRAIRDLRNQHALFEQSIELLLAPVTDGQQLNEMIDNTNSGLWKDPDIEGRLKENLGRAYQPYLRTVQDIQTTMIGIALKLDNVDGVKNLNRDGLEAIISQHVAAKVNGKLQKFEISKRVKFTMKKKNIKQSLQELQSYNDLLDKFHIKAEKITAIDEPYKSDRRSTFTLHADTIRENAKRLYNVISNTWCLTHSSHSAGLLLEQRLAKKRKGGPGQNRRRPAPSHFDINCFSLSLLQSSTSASKKWLDVEVRVVEAHVSGQNNSSTVQIRTSAPPSVSVTSPPTSLPYSNPSQLQIVTDLCSMLQNPCHPCIGFCLDIDDRLRGAYDAQRSVAYVDGGVSLQEILTTVPGGLSGKEQYDLSLTLASSILQLSHTPWLQESWSKADILFLRAKDQHPGHKVGVDLKHPYLTREHTQATALIRRTTGEPNDSSKILALGIMLLEICSGVPIETLLRPDDLGPNNQPNEISHLQAARRWVMEKQDRGECSYAFIEAISYCLQCFMNPSARLSDLAFSKTIEERVLAPLDTEMNMVLFGPTQI